MLEFGIGFAKNAITAITERFGSLRNVLLMHPHCLATVSDPRYAGMTYFEQRPGTENVIEDIIDIIKVEIESNRRTTQTHLS
jgi:hypothetical protein